MNVVCSEIGHMQLSFSKPESTMSFQEVRYTVKVPNTGRGGDGSCGADDRWLKNNLSASDVVGTEANAWEWVTASSSRLIARLFKGLMEFFKGR